jgi:hypothetical protein
MKKLFETEIVTHRMAAILKTDLYSKLEHCKLRTTSCKKIRSLFVRCADGNSDFSTTTTKQYEEYRNFSG